jgi:integrase
MPKDLGQDHHLKPRKSGAYVCQLSVPVSLRDRAGKAVLEEYLGTSDLRAARRKRDGALGRLRARLDALRREDEATEEALQAIRVGEQYRHHGAMVEDPVEAPRKLATRLGDLDLEGDARRSLESIGLPVTEANVRMAQQAIADGMGGALVLFERGLTPPQPKPYRASVIEDSPGGPTVMEVADAYEKAAGTGTTEKTRKQTAKSVRLLASHVGGKSARSVTGRDIGAFVDALGRIDPEYRREPKARGKTLAKLVEEHPGEGLSAATTNRHISNIASALKWAAKREDWQGWTCPTIGRSVKADEDDPDGRWEPSTDSEVGKLLEGVEAPHKPATGFRDGLYWALLIGAYAGLRAGEIGNLTGDDVVAWEDGTLVFRVKDGKTEAARRIVPVHPELQRRGIVEYAGACGDGRLIGCDGATLAKRFPAYRRDQGVDRHGVVFHSLRKSFTTKLERLDVPSDTAALLLGHKGLRSFTYGRYSGGHAPARLAEVVGGVRYELKEREAAPCG